jgi:pimeloyl-ACP methyl ester carboxylesterase
MQRSSIIVSGRTVRYLSGGDPDGSRVLVLLHPFPVGTATWQPQLDAFPDWRVVVPALPGFDGSDLYGDSTVDAFAAHVDAFLSALGITQAVFGGLSMGGYVLLALWRRRRSLISGMVLADTRSGADGAEARGVRQKMLETLATHGPGVIADEVIPKLLGETTRRERPDVVSLCRQRIESQTADAIGSAIRAMMTRPDAGPSLSSIDVPALVLVGEEDVLTPPSEAEQLQRGIPGASLVRIPGAGHLSSLENPTAFNEATAGFLRTCRG